MGLKTYNEIEKFLDVDTKTKKDEKHSKYFFEHTSLGHKTQRHFRGSFNDEINYNNNLKENEFISKLDLPRQTYNEIKFKVLKLSITERSESKSKFLN